MFRNGVRTWPRRSAAVLFIAGIFIGLSGFAQGQSAVERAVLEPAEAEQVADTALAYAEVVYVVGEEEERGFPYLWGGRTGLQAFRSAIEDAHVTAVAGGGTREGAIKGLGVDASGLVVAVLRDVFPGVRFNAAEGNGAALWADVTSALLYEYNSVAVEPSALRAGDLVFFGTLPEDEAVNVSGVGIVTGRSGTRVDFVVASAGQGRVIHTFARADGDYWRDNIVGTGRLALPRTD